MNNCKGCGHELEEAYEMCGGTYCVVLESEPLPCPKCECFNDTGSGSHCGKCSCCNRKGN